MSTSLTLITAPTVEPVSNADAKAFCRVDATADDNLFTSLIVAARRAAESYTKRALCTQTWEWQFDGPPGDVLFIPKPPLLSITSIKFTDTDGTEGAAVASSVYTVDTGRSPGRVLLNPGQNWGYTSLRSFLGTRVKFVAGYGATAADGATAGSVPEDLALAIKRIVLTNFEAREDNVIGTIASKIPDDAKSLLDPYRVIRL